MTDRLECFGRRQRDARHNTRGRLPLGDLRARLGPVTTTIRSAAILPASAITSLIRNPVPSSIPFARLTTMAFSGIRH